MELDDDTWYIVRNTPGVTGFVGPSGSKPTPLSRSEVEDILGVAKPEGPAAEKKVRPRVEFEEGEQVRVVTGPFADFNGAISEIDCDGQAAQECSSERLELQRRVRDGGP